MTSYNWKMGRQSLSVACTARYQSYMDQREAEKCNDEALTYHEYKEMFFLYADKMNAYEDWYRANEQRHLSGDAQFNRECEQWVEGLRILETLLKIE